MVSVNFVQARLTVIASIALSAMVSDLRNAEVFVSLNQVSLSLRIFNFQGDTPLAEGKICHKN